MKFVLANWGTRGEVEPYVTVGRELVRRGHDVRMAVAPEMVDFVESAGPAAVAYGPDLKVILDPHRDFWTYLFGNPWKIRELDRMWREVQEPLTQCRGEVSKTLTSLADGADLLLTGMNYEDTRCQRRGVLRHSVGHAAYLPVAGQRPAPAIPAGAVGPRRNDHVRVAVVARTKEGRGRAAP